MTTQTKIKWSKNHDPNQWESSATAFGPIEIRLPGGEIVSVEEFLRRGYQLRWGNAIILGLDNVQ